MIFFDQICSEREFQIENGKIAFMRPSMVVTYYIKLSWTGAYRHNGILMSLRLLAAETKSPSQKLIERNTDATENSITETTDLLPKQNDLLLQKNGSKNTVIKILAENQQQAIYFIYFIFI